jgi:hypothetical protein
MRSPIRTPEAAAYGVAVLAVLIPSAATLAARLHGRVAALARAPFGRVHAAVLAGVATWGFAVLPPGPLWAPGPGFGALAVALGTAVGAATFALDRHLLRRARATPRPRRRAVAAPPTLARGGAAWGQGSSGGFDLPTLVLVGALEEVVFRGHAVELALRLPGRVAPAAAVAAGVGLFALGHVAFGWREVGAKLLLGGAALAALLATGSVLAAVAAHVCFNVRAWAAHRGRMVPGGRSAAAAPAAVRR